MRRLFTPWWNHLASARGERTLSVKVKGGLTNVGALLQKLKERSKDDPELKRLKNINKDKLQLYESEKAKEDFSILSNRIQFKL